jgi:hypothetical protein
MEQWPNAFEVAVPGITAGAFKLNRSSRLPIVGAQQFDADLAKKTPEDEQQFRCHDETKFGAFTAHYLLYSRRVVDINRRRPVFVRREAYAVRGVIVAPTL